MASKRLQLLPLGGGVLAIVLLTSTVGCGSGEDNSPSMGKVAPKPNMAISSQLPAAIREQMSQARPGADASKMSSMKPHPPKP